MSVMDLSSPKWRIPEDKYEAISVIEQMSQTALCRLAGMTVQDTCTIWQYPQIFC